MVTLFLAELWGPILLAIGLGFFFSRKYYVKVYRDLEKEAFAVLFFGMFAIAAGITHVMVHNLWGTLAESVISILGWGLLLKGVICVVFPGFADKASDWALNSKIVPAAGVLILILGIYLTWAGYFA
jgi:hypothetical protein